ncbi:MAG: transposase family protein [Bacteroidota bacterium]|nr:transposase family protein [Bacteroidota bacterium]
MVISLKSRWIGFLSHFHPGKHHHYSLLKKIFFLKNQWFKKFLVRLDLYFPRFDKACHCKEYFLPIKKPTGQDLTEAQRAVNKAPAAERIVVEHAIGCLKRYRILSDRLRMHDLERYDDVLGVCAGLWNFYLCPDLQLATILLGK